MDEIQLIKDNSEFCGYVEFRSLTCKHLTINRSDLIRGLKFSFDSEIERVSIRNSYLDGFKLFDSGSSKNKNLVSIYESEFKATVIIVLINRTLILENVTGSKLIVIIGNSGIGLENNITLRGKILFSQGIEIISLKESLERDLIEESDLHEDLHFSTVEKVELNRFSIDDAMIFSDINVFEISIKRLNFENSTFNNKLKVTGVNISYYRVGKCNFNKEQNFELRDVIVKESFFISSSRLYNKSFINCSIDEVNNFELKNTDLSEVLSVNTSWKLEGVDYSLANSCYFKFVQIRYKNEGQLIKLQNAQVAILENTRATTSSKFDKLLLTLGYSASKHGSCFKTSLIGFIGINLVLFLFVNLIITIIGFTSQGISLENLSQLPLLNVIDAITLLNPTHRMESISYKGGEWFYIFDWFTRVVNSYFIFQMIKSSRKYFSIL
ncbi:hypothetical protein [Pseudoalteromonas sp. B160]|uniref:hypothetical protein n=1 Tax=Pseudoalteromonas sp. B160 TaxID=630414 RepID=UPI00301B6F1B